MGMQTGQNIFRLVLFFLLNELPHHLLEQLAFPLTGIGLASISKCNENTNNKSMHFLTEKQ